jgi:CheY-like chemotaxis protein
MNKTILLVDKDHDFLTQVKYYLEKLGFHVVLADTQKEAEDIIARLRPDLAVTELMLENEDGGFVLCYKLKKLYPDVPIIIVTEVSRETGLSFGLESDEEKKWIKAEAYLEKNVKPEQLYKEILKLLKM